MEEDIRDGFLVIFLLGFDMDQNLEIFREDRVIDLVPMEPTDHFEFLLERIDFQRLHTIVHLRRLDNFLLEIDR